MIEPLHIEGTRKTPSVFLDPQGTIRIEGRSIPEDASIFFEAPINWVNKYTQLKNRETKVDFSFEYLNSGTSKMVLLILNSLKVLYDQGLSVTINWYYEEGDDDILERGEYYASTLHMKINLIEME